MKARILTVFTLAIGLTIALVWVVGAQGEIGPVQKEKDPNMIPQVVEHPQASDATVAVARAAVFTNIIEFVDAPRQCSQMTDRSLALDGAGNPHIACGKDGLYYFRHDGTQWHETVLATGRVGTYASLDLEPTAPYTPHISYYDITNSALKYAHLTAGGWVIETVDDTGAASQYTSLALDSNGDPHISYHQSWPYNNLKYARLTAGGWVSETVDDDGSSGNVGWDTSLALEPTAPYTPHISYYDFSHTALKHAHLGATGWVSETVDSYGSTGRYTSLALAPTAPYTPHISYQGTGSNLKHAYLSATVWVSKVVDSSASVGYFTSLALDGDGRARISYFDTTNDDLKYAFDAGGGVWIPWTVDTAGHGYTSLALESTAPYTPHISYYASGDLKYLSFVGATSWVSQVVRTGNDVGEYSSLALEPTAPYTPHISYYESLAGDLKYAYRTAAGWVSETVETSGTVGAYTSLALDGGGYPHISYYDNTNEDLKYAHLTAGGWVSDAVDTSGDVGEYTSLALDGDDYPHISYYDDTFDNLKYAHLTASGWVSETVDASGNIGRDSTSLALEPTAPYTPHISYYDSINDHLKYAHLTASGWVSETVDASGSVGEYSSLVLDGSGRPHIGYYDSDNDHPKYAYLTEGGWVSETIDSGSDGGDYISIALDRRGSPHVCYIDTVGPYHLEYARRAGSSWILEMVDSSDGVGEYCSLELDGNGYPHMSYYDWHLGDLKYAYLPGSLVYLPFVSRD